MLMQYCSFTKTCVMGGIDAYVQGFPKKTPVSHKSKIFLINSVMIRKF